MSTSGGTCRSVIATSMADSPTPRLVFRSTFRRRNSMRGASSSTSRRCPTASTSRRTRTVSRTGSASPSRAAPTSWRRTVGGPPDDQGHPSTRPLRPTGPMPRPPALRGSWPPRCTASTGPTATPTGGAVAATAPSAAPRTHLESGTASSPTSSGHLWRYRTCSRCECTPKGCCATASTRSSTPWSRVEAATCSRASLRRNEMPSPR